MRIIVIALALGIATIGLARADSFSIALPGLAGGYEADSFTEPNPGHPQMRSIDFVFPDGITAIDQLELSVSGDWSVGEIVCDDGSGPQTSPFFVALSVFVTSDAFPGDWFGASVAPPDGSFSDQRGEFSSCCPPDVLDYAALLGADLRLEFYVDWALIGICGISEDSYGTVSDVRLEILGTVGTESETWSSVKALYR